MASRTARCGCAGHLQNVSHARLGWRGLERIWGKYLSYHVSADRYSAPWSAAEHTVLAQLAGDSSLSWKQKAVRLEELVSGAPRRSHLAVKRRWANDSHSNAASPSSAGSPKAGSW